MSILKRRKEDDTFEIVGDHSLPIRYMPSGEPSAEDYIPFDSGTGAKKCTVEDLVDSSLRINGTQVDIAVADWTSDGSVWVCTKAVTGMSATYQLNVSLASEPTATTFALWKAMTIEAGTGTIIAVSTIEPTVPISFSIFNALSVKSITGTNVAEMTYSTVSGNNIIFDNKMLDASGVYDSTIGKDQDEINEKVNLKAGTYDLILARATETTLTDLVCDYKKYSFLFIAAGNNYAYSSVIVPMAIVPNAYAFGFRGDVGGTSPQVYYEVRNFESTKFQYMVSNSVYPLSIFGIY